MNEHLFEVMGLDKDFNLVSLLRYSNLQWSRKFYEMGTFSIQIPIEQYEANIKYIYTKDRPEVGEISQINYIEKNGTKTFALSGYFLENELNRRIAYKKSTGNITNAPAWVNQAGKAEDVATAFFNAFKDVTFTRNEASNSYPLGIATTASKGRGKQSDHYRVNEYLGNKIHSILKPSEMSYRVVYDFADNKKTFECWAGIDRTQNNSELNNPVIFSTRYGNLKNPNILWSDTDYKNGFITTNTYTEENIEYIYVQSNVEKAVEDTSIRFLNVESNVSRSNYSSIDDYYEAMQSDGHTNLLKAAKTISFDFDCIEGSYDYMTDFDLGDKCSLEVKEMDLYCNAVLTGCNEVIKNGTWNLSMEFDV